MTKKNNLLHILNGDGTYFGFKESGISGDYFIWREALAIGPVIEDINSDKFTAMRRNYLLDPGDDERIYEVLKKSDFMGKSKTGYFDKLILWFEFDLFCQINMIAALWFINHHTIKSDISLISVDSFPNHPNFKGYGELNGDEQFQLLDKQINLNPEDIQIAAQIWELYASKDQLKLQSFIETVDLMQFPHLKTAIKYHFRRFPSTENGLNQIESDMLKRIANGIESERKLIGSILRDDRFYSLGDMYYFKSLERLKDCYSCEKDHLQLTKTGQDILSMSLHFSEISDPVAIGGSLSNQFSYNNQMQQLVKN